MHDLEITKEKIEKQDVVLAQQQEKLEKQLSVIQNRRSRLTVLFLP